MIFKFLILFIFFDLSNCLYNKSKLCKCDIPNSLNKKTKSRIIGGESAHDVPWQVNIQYSFYEHNAPFNKNGSDQCSGVILNDNWILTAAKCLEEMKKNLPENYISIGYGSSSKSKHKIAEVDRTYIHENYNYKENSNDYDIGLIKLEAPLNISEKNLSSFSPACFIDDDNEMINYGDVSLTGHGIFKSNFKAEDIHKFNGSDVLRKAYFIDDSKSGKYEKCKKSKKFICLTGLKTKNNSNFSQICYGDFGAPLTKIYKNKRFVVGIASHEKSNEELNPKIKCDANGNAGLVTRLSSHLYWIKAHIDDLCLFDKLKYNLLK